MACPGYLENSSNSQSHKNSSGEISNLISTSMTPFGNVGFNSGSRMQERISNEDSENLAECQTMQNYREIEMLKAQNQGDLLQDCHLERISLRAHSQSSSISPHTSEGSTIDGDEEMTLKQLTALEGTEKFDLQSSSDMIGIWQLFSQQTRHDRNITTIPQRLMKVTAQVILAASWTKVPPEKKTELEEYLLTSGRCMDNEDEPLWGKMFRNVALLINNNVWHTPHLQKVYNEVGLTIETANALWEAEGCVILEIRLEKLCQAKAYDNAIPLAEACVLKGHYLYEKDQDIECGTSPFYMSQDKYYEFSALFVLILHRQDLEDDTNRFFPLKKYNCTPFCLAVAERLSCPEISKCIAPKWKKGWKYSEDAAVQFLHATLMDSIQSEISLTELKLIFSAWLDLSIKLSVADQCNSREGSSSVNVDEETSRLIIPSDEIENMAKVAAKSDYIYLIADCIIEKETLHQEARSKCLELYVPALISDINTMESLKSNEANKAEVAEFGQKLSVHYLSLANYFQDDGQTRFELLLTCFSLNPTPEILEELCIIAEGKTENGECTPAVNVCEVVSTSNKAEILRLPVSLYENLHTIVTNPRWARLNCFRQSWEEFKPVCIKHLETRGEDIKGVQDLELVTPDYSKYEDLKSAYDENDHVYEPGYGPAESDLALQEDEDEKIKKMTREPTHRLKNLNQREQVLRNTEKFYKERANKNAYKEKLKNSLMKVQSKSKALLKEGGNRHRIYPTKSRKHEFYYPNFPGKKGRPSKQEQPHGSYRPTHMNIAVKPELELLPRNLPLSGISPEDTRIIPYITEVFPPTKGHYVFSKGGNNVGSIPREVCTWMINSLTDETPTTHTGSQSLSIESAANFEKETLELENKYRLRRKTWDMIKTQKLPKPSSKRKNGIPIGRYFSHNRKDWEHWMRFAKWKKPEAVISTPLLTPPTPLPPPQPEPPNQFILNPKFVFTDNCPPLQHSPLDFAQAPPLTNPVNLSNEEAILWNSYQNDYYRALISQVFPQQQTNDQTGVAGPSTCLDLSKPSYFPPSQPMSTLGEQGLTQQGNYPFFPNGHPSIHPPSSWSDGAHLVPHSSEMVQEMNPPFLRNEESTTLAEIGIPRPDPSQALDCSVEPGYSSLPSPIINNDQGGVGGESECLKTEINGYIGAEFKDQLKEFLGFSAESADLPRPEFQTLPESEPVSDVFIVPKLEDLTEVTLANTIGATLRNLDPRPEDIPSILNPDTVCNEISKPLDPFNLESTGAPNLEPRRDFSSGHALYSTKSVNPNDVCNKDSTPIQFSTQRTDTADVRIRQDFPRNHELSDLVNSISEVYNEESIPIPTGCKSTTDLEIRDQNLDFSSHYHHHDSQTSVIPKEVCTEESIALIPFSQGCMNRPSEKTIRENFGTEYHHNSSDQEKILDSSSADLLQDIEPSVLQNEQTNVIDPELPSSVKGKVEECQLPRDTKNDEISSFPITMSSTQSVVENLTLLNGCSETENVPMSSLNFTPDLGSAPGPAEQNSGPLITILSETTGELLSVPEYLDCDDVNECSPKSEPLTEIMSPPASPDMFLSSKDSDDIQNDLPSIPTTPVIEITPPCITKTVKIILHRLSESEILKWNRSVRPPLVLPDPDEPLPKSAPPFVESAPIPVVSSPAPSLVESEPSENPSSAPTKRKRSIPRLDSPTPFMLTRNLVKKISLEIDVKSSLESPEISTEKNEHPDAETVGVRKTNENQRKVLAKVDASQPELDPVKANGTLAVDGNRPSQSRRDCRKRHRSSNAVRQKKSSKRRKIPLKTKTQTPKANKPKCVNKKQDLVSEDELSELSDEFQEDSSDSDFVVSESELGKSGSDEETSGGVQQLIKILPTPTSQVNIFRGPVLKVFRPNRPGEVVSVPIMCVNNINESSDTEDQMKDPLGDPLALDPIEMSPVSAPEVVDLVSDSEMDSQENVYFPEPMRKDDQMNIIIKEEPFLLKTNFVLDSIGTPIEVTILHSETKFSNQTNAPQKFIKSMEEFKSTNPDVHSSGPHVDVCRSTEGVLPHNRSEKSLEEYVFLTKDVPLEEAVTIEENCEPNEGVHEEVDPESLRDRVNIVLPLPESDCDNVTQPSSEANELDDKPSFHSEDTKDEEHFFIDDKSQSLDGADHIEQLGDDIVCMRPSSIPVSELSKEILLTQDQMQLDTNENTSPPGTTRMNVDILDSEVHTTNLPEICQISIVESCHAIENPSESKLPLLVAQEHSPNDGTDINEASSTVEPSRREAEVPTLCDSHHSEFEIDHTQDSVGSFSQPLVLTSEELVELSSPNSVGTVVPSESEPSRSEAGTILELQCEITQELRTDSPPVVTETLQDSELDINPSNSHEEYEFSDSILQTHPDQPEPENNVMGLSEEAGLTGYNVSTFTKELSPKEEFLSCSEGDHTSGDTGEESRSSTPEKIPKTEAIPKTEDVELQMEVGTSLEDIKPESISMVQNVYDSRSQLLSTNEVHQSNHFKARRRNSTLATIRRTIFSARIRNRVNQSRGQFIALLKADLRSLHLEDKSFPVLEPMLPRENKLDSEDLWLDTDESPPVLERYERTF